MRVGLGLLLFITLLHSATISGSLYSSDSFDKLNNTLVKFSGPEHEQVLSADGDFRVELLPGNYSVSATHIEGGRITHMAEERLVVGSADQTLDIVLLPPEFFEDDGMPDLELEIKDKEQPSMLFTAAIVVLSLAALVILWKKYTMLKSKTGGKAVLQEKPQELGQEESTVLNILSENEGRMEQKELRDILKYSETKMSLLLTELEVLGHVKRFRKGRQNIVKLKKGM